MMNYNAKYDIIECVISHSYKVKYDQRGVPTNCLKCEPVNAENKKRKTFSYNSFTKRDNFKNMMV